MAYLIVFFLTFILFSFSKNIQFTDNPFLNISLGGKSSNVRQSLLPIEINFVKRSTQLKTETKIKRDQVGLHREDITPQIAKINIELSTKIKLLQYIMVVEFPLADLADKDRNSVAKLEECLKVKVEVQKRIIVLTQKLAYFETLKPEI